MNTIPVRILLVEDNPADAVLIQEMLLGSTSGAFELNHADRIKNALDQLTQGCFEAILLDLTLPDSCGLATLEHIRSVAKGIPTIILTGVEDEELAINAIRHGAQDYLVKGTADGHAIAKAIRYAIDRKKVEDALRKSEAAYTTAKVSVDTVNAMEEGVALINMDGTIRSMNPALIRLAGYPREQMEGRNLAALLAMLVDPDDLVMALNALETAMRGEIPELGEMMLISKTTSRIPIIPRVAFIKDHSGKPATIVLTVQDITEHKKVERQQQIVTTLLALFARKTSRKEYLDAVTRVVHQWSGCRCVGIRIRNENGEVPYESHIGFSDEFTASESALMIGKDQCACTRIIAGQPDAQDLPCMTEGKSFRCDNTLKFLATLSEKEKERFRGICIKMGFLSVAIVPIRYYDITLGAVHFADEKAGKMSAEMLEFAETTLSPIVGEAIHRFNIETELRALSSRLTLAEEHARRELAIALHDTVGQTLALTKIKMGSLGQLVTEEEPKKALAEIRKMFDEAVRQIRTLSFELSLPILYELGLNAAIEWLAEDFTRRHGLKIQYQGITENCRLAESITILFFQSTRELLTNITKHAEATEVRMFLMTDDGHIVMKIIDNGKGMEGKEPWNAIGLKNSLGLFSIRERMKYIGGTFKIESSPGHGTTTILTVPMEEPASMGAGIHN